MDMNQMMAPQASPEQEGFAKESGGHAEMMAQVLMGLGRLEAKIDMLRCDEAEDEAESEGPELATNPALNSTMLELPDLPPIF